MVDVLMASNQSIKNLTFKAQDETQIERQFLKGKKDEELGVYCKIFSAKSSFKGQDGGVVTALLASGFEKGMFDAAIVVTRVQGYYAEAAVAQNIEEILSANGTKYLRVNVTAKLKELIGQGKKHIAIVCTPCEAKATRKIQQKLKTDCKIIVIGLFCFEAFNHDKLKEKIQNRFGVDIDLAEKTQVHHGKFEVYIEGGRYSCDVKQLDGAADKVCVFCDDFTSRFADVSVGSVGSKEGYSTVIVRSPLGEKLVEKIEVKREIADKAEVIRLAKFKRERSQKVFANQKKAS